MCVCVCVCMRRESLRNWLTWSWGLVNVKSKGQQARNSDRLWWGGVTSETVDMWPQVQDLGCVTLELMEGWPQWQELGRGLTLELEDTWAQVQGLGGVSPHRLWIWDPRHRVWGWSPGRCRHVNPGAGLGGGHSGDCGLVSPGAQCGKWGHPGDCGCEAPGTGSGVGSYSGIYSIAWANWIFKPKVF